MTHAQSVARLQLRFHDSIADLSAGQWNALVEDHHPFLLHEFLVALERNSCVGDQFGWYPRHLAVYDQNGGLLAATPLYIKTNSYGEFVFDWSWASAYEQAGLHYYPKLVSATPYNPVTGSRLMVHPQHYSQASTLRRLMIKTIIEYCEQTKLSGMHWLFTTEEEQQALRDCGLMQRLGCQYHWQNSDYQSFEDFIEQFTSRKRKKVKRERRRVQDQGIDLRVMHGNEIGPDLWSVIHNFYTSTFDRKSGIPTLSLEFFREIGQTMGKAIVVTMAYFQNEPVACSICLKSDTALFGRFWGCHQEFHSLHFEACFYQGIDYCIQHKLKRFEPGAQGEHKIARGFLPVETWSAHWISHSRFRTILEEFCQREEQMMHEQCRELKTLSPYRVED